MAQILNLTGQKFGRLTAIVPGPRRGSACTWICECDCTSFSVVRTAALRNGLIRSCGCGRARHGHARDTGNGRSRAYRSWDAMRDRTTNPRSQAYANYGGRGITLCDEWRDFSTFLADMGEPGPGLSLDRIDNDGNYEPSNCRWATVAEQGRNRRTTKLNSNDAAVIRARRAAGETCMAIAADFGIASQTVGKIANGLRWA